METRGKRGEKRGKEKKRKKEKRKKGKKEKRKKGKKEKRKKGKKGKKKRKKAKKEKKEKRKSFKNARMGNHAKRANVRCALWDDTCCFHDIRLGPKTSECEKNVSVKSTVTKHASSRREAVCVRFARRPSLH